MNAIDLIRRLRRADDRRPGLPGEHWATFGMGLSLFGAARRARSPLGRIAFGVAAALLVARAAGGRDGIARALRGGGALSKLARR